MTRSRTTTYEDDGRVATQTTMKGGVKESYVIYGDSTYVPPGEYWYYDPFTGQYVYESWGGNWTPGYDAAGVLRGYIVKVYNTQTWQDPNDVLYTSTYALSYRNGATYQETGTTVTSSPSPPGPQSGSTGRQYNVNGELVATTDSREPTRNRYYANDANGNPITVVQGNFDGVGGHYTPQQAFAHAIASTGGYNTTKSQHFFYALGHHIGSFGQLNEGGTFKANFDVNYTPVSQNYPSSAPSEVVAQKGDTLKIIAARVWGDANLWYLLAEENGLSHPDAALEPGMIIRVPNEVVSMSNAAFSFKPFDLRLAIGDTTPTQPAPPMPKPKKKGCGVLGQILVIAIAVVVTFYTAGLASGAVGSFMQVMGAGVSAGVGASVAGAAVGSIVSQGVAVAIGVQDKFSWKGVALAAIAGGVTAGINASPLGTAVKAAAEKGTIAFGRLALNSALGNAMTQGIAVATGLQDKFSWRDVAISAAAAPVSAGATRNMTNVFTRSLTSSLTSSAVRVALGGKVDTATVIADAFGNAIGNSIVAQSERYAAQWAQFRAERALLRRAEKEGEQAFVDDLMASFGSREAAESFLYSPEGEEHVALLEARVSAGRPWEQLSPQRQAEALRDFRMTDRTDYNIDPEPSPIRVEETILVVGRRPEEGNFIDSAAGVIDIGARGVNKLVSLVGGPRNAQLVITGGSLLIMGPARTVGGMLVDQVTSVPIQAAEEWLSDKLEKYVFMNGSAQPESVATVSDTAAMAGVGLAEQALLGRGADRIVEGSQSYVRNAKKLAEEIRVSNAQRIANETPTQRAVGAGRPNVHVHNGYTYTIDDVGRTTRIEGELVGNPGQSRNVRAQRQAGGPDRLSTDEGGHFIGRRFDGPTEAINHFAQDRNFNRSRYKILENEWQRALDSGKKVHVDIRPTYPGESLRPNRLEIFYTIDGELYRTVLRNRRGG